MAGTLVVTQSVIGHALHDPVTKYSMSWTSDASGNVNGAGAQISVVTGTIVSVSFVPAAAADQPSDLYDVTFKCIEHNIADVFNGEGANLSNATSTDHVVFALQTGGTSFIRKWLHGGTYELNVANAGNAKKGLIDLYIHTGVL